eukprot:6178398-Pleurochrysis_carterae.AAC.3
MGKGVGRGVGRKTWLHVFSIYVSDLGFWTAFWPSRLAMKATCDEHQNVDVAAPYAAAHANLHAAFVGFPLQCCRRT